MAMVAHNPKAAKRVGIPQKVGKHFTDADKGRKFGEGGIADKLKGYWEDVKQQARDAIEATKNDPSLLLGTGMAKQAADALVSSNARNEHKRGGSVKRKFADGGINIPNAGLYGGRPMMPPMAGNSPMPPSAVPPGAMPMNGMPSRGFPSGGFRPNMGGRDRDERGMGPRFGMNPMQQASIIGALPGTFGQQQGSALPGTFGQQQGSALPGTFGQQQGTNQQPQQQAGIVKAQMASPGALGQQQGTNQFLQGMSPLNTLGQGQQMPLQGSGGDVGGMPNLNLNSSSYSPGLSSVMNNPSIGMKKGGHVKPSELKGKAKETKSIAKEEMKALKRGHAPKKVMEHERAEHKAMGYKHGGKIHPAKVGKDETKQVKYKMKETAGGRKPPHGKHDSEGDTKLKGFGMSHSVHAGHGRKVSKPATPKDEMPTKGFAMKKGGHVKKHTKNMKRGGVSARMKKAPSIGPMMGGLPPALASASPPPPMVGAGGPPPGGMPGMKKGGHVSHHHHHHYAKGGSVRPGIDEKAERGHTKGKMIKMASGGHVGSRADGIASKGRTRCKVY